MSTKWRTDRKLPKIQVFLRNNMDELKDRLQREQLSRVKTIVTTAVIRETSQDVHQNQTTITTNNNYMQNFMSIFKKNLMNKVKITSHETETKQHNLYFKRKIRDYSIIRLGNKQTKENKKTAALKSWPKFLKTINFKLIKAKR